MNKSNQEFPLDIQVENDSERYTDRNLEIDEDDEGPPCHICLDVNSYENNEIIFCDKCDVPVHQFCYSVNEIPEGEWFCDVCASGGDPKTTKCELCPNTGGAYKKSNIQGIWAHGLCSSWIPEVFHVDSRTLNLSHLDKQRTKLKCSICSTTHKGHCIQCSYGRCTVSVHPWCAILNPQGFTHRIIKNDSADTVWEVFCKNHATAVMEPFKPKVKSKLSKPVALDISPIEEIESKSNLEHVSTKPSGKSKVYRDEISDDDDYVDNNGLKTSKSSDISSKHRGKVPSKTSNELSKPKSSVVASSTSNMTSNSKKNFPILTLSEWPGQSEGEGIDLDHFWNVVSFAFPEQHSKEWCDYVTAVFKPYNALTPDILSFPRLGPVYTLDQLSSENEVFSASDRDRQSVTDVEKRNRLLNNIYKNIYTLSKPSLESSSGGPVVYFDEAMRSVDEQNLFLIKNQNHASMQSSVIGNNSFIRAVFDASDHRFSCEFNLIQNNRNQKSVENSIDSDSKSVRVDETIDMEGMEIAEDEKIFSSEIEADNWIDDNIIPARSVSVGSSTDIEQRNDKDIELSLHSFNVYPDDKEVLLCNGDVIISKNDDDILCRMLRSDQLAYKLAMETIQKRVDNLLANNVNLVSGSSIIYREKYKEVENLYLRQKTWRKVAYGFYNGVKDQPSDFNKRLLDDIPASWSLHVDGRPTQETSVFEIPDTENNEEFVEDTVCMCCFDGKSTDDNHIIFCDGCNSPVHQACYGILEVPEGNFFCDRCREIQDLARTHGKFLTKEDMLSVSCCLCPVQHGGIKPTTDGRWVHICCAVWSKDSIIVDINEMSPIDLRNIQTQGPIQHYAFGTGNLSSTYQRMFRSSRGNAESEFSMMIPFNTCVICKTYGGHVVRCQGCNILQTVPPAHIDPTMNDLSKVTVTVDELQSPPKTYRITSKSTQHLAQGDVSTQEMNPSFQETAAVGVTACSCNKYFHPLCAWFEGYRIDTSIIDPSLQGKDRFGFFPSGLDFKFYCNAHNPDSSLDNKPPKNYDGRTYDQVRADQKTLRRKYKLKDEDLEGIPGKSHKKKRSKQQHKRSNNISSPLQLHNSSSSGFFVHNVNARGGVGSTREKELPEDIYDNKICGICMSTSKLLIDTDAWKKFKNITMTDLPIQPEDNYITQQLNDVGDDGQGVQSTGDSTIPTLVETDQSSIESNNIKGDTIKATTIATTIATTDDVKSKPKMISPTSNQSGLVTCKTCQLTVHTYCLQDLMEVSSTNWQCSPCSSRLTAISGRAITGPIDCVCYFCPRRGGFFVPTTCDKWAHAFCAKYAAGNVRILRGMNSVVVSNPALTVTSDNSINHQINGQNIEIDGSTNLKSNSSINKIDIAQSDKQTSVNKSAMVDIRQIAKENRKQKCILCNRKSGICSKCCFEGCGVYVHPICAQRLGKGFSRCRFGQSQYFCQDHIPEFIERVNFPAEKLSSSPTARATQVIGGHIVDTLEIQRLRYSLDRVRVIFDGISRREKYKRLLSKADSEAYAIKLTQILDKVKGRKSDIALIENCDAELFEDSSDDEVEDIFAANSLSELYDETNGISKRKSQHPKLASPNPFQLSETSLMSSSTSFVNPNDWIPGLRTKPSSSIVETQTKLKLHIHGEEAEISSSFFRYLADSELISEGSKVSANSSSENDSAENNEQNNSELTTSKIIVKGIIEADASEINGSNLNFESASIQSTTNESLEVESLLADKLQKVEENPVLSTEEGIETVSLSIESKSASNNHETTEELHKTTALLPDELEASPPTKFVKPYVLTTPTRLFLAIGGYEFDKRETLMEGGYKAFQRVFKDRMLTVVEQSREACGIFTTNQQYLEFQRKIAPSLIRYLDMPNDKFKVEMAKEGLEFKYPSKNIVPYNQDVSLLAKKRKKGYVILDDDEEVKLTKTFGLPDRKSLERNSGVNGRYNDEVDISHVTELDGRNDYQLKFTMKEDGRKSNRKKNLPVLYNDYDSPINSSTQNRSNGDHKVDSKDFSKYPVDINEDSDINASSRRQISSIGALNSRSQESEIRDDKLSNFKADSSIDGRKRRYSEILHDEIPSHISSPKTMFKNSIKKADKNIINSQLTNNEEDEFNEPNANTLVTNGETNSMASNKSGPYLSPDALATMLSEDFITQSLVALNPVIYHKVPETSVEENNIDCLPNNSNSIAELLSSAGIVSHSVLPTHYPSTTDTETGFSLLERYRDKYRDKSTLKLFDTPSNGIKRSTVNAPIISSTFSNGKLYDNCDENDWIVYDDEHLAILERRIQDILVIVDNYELPDNADAVHHVEKFIYHQIQKNKEAEVGIEISSESSGSALKDNDNNSSPENLDHQEKYSFNKRKRHKVENFITNVIFEKKKYKKKDAINSMNKGSPNAMDNVDSQSEMRYLVEDFIDIPEESLPAYYDFVRHVISIEVLKAQLQSHKFRSMATFCKSFYEMLNNGRAATPINSKIWRDSEALAKLFEFSKLASFIGDNSARTGNEELNYHLIDCASTIEPLVVMKCLVCQNQYNMLNWPEKFQISLADMSWICHYCIRKTHLLGRKVKVWWNADETYYSGYIDAIDPVTGRYRIQYEDGEWEFISLSVEPVLISNS